MFRVELLQFLKCEEIVKLALTCRKMKELIDPNATILQTDENGDVLK
jgi:hypothetical protein